MEDTLLHWRIKKGWSKGPGLREKLKRLSRLQILNISGNRIWIVCYNSHLLIAGCADDTLLSLLGLHCPQLRALTASHSLDLTDAGLASLQPRDSDDISSQVWVQSRLETNQETDNNIGATEISRKSDHSSAALVARPKIGTGNHGEDVHRDSKSSQVRS